VIKGKALIQLRRIGTDEVLDFYLDGEEPAYVDMPIWYTHNIKNIGDEVLYTNFGSMSFMIRRMGIRILRMYEGTRMVLI